MRVLPVPCATDFAKGQRRRMITFWSVGVPDFDLRVREGLCMGWLRLVGP